MQKEISDEEIFSSMVENDFVVKMKPKSVSMQNGFEYNISAKIAELIKNFVGKYDYIELTFVSKDCKNHKNQNIYFLGKEGQILNGKK